jgi:uncharacterized iron-regulated membrane protein
MGWIVYREGVGEDSRVRKLLLSIHLSIALIAGVVIVILGVTGSIIAFEPELDHLLHPRLSYVSPGTRLRSLTEIGALVSKQFGGEPIIAYLPSTSPGIASEVVVPTGIVSVNQYTGEVLGVRTRGQTFLGLARAVHVRLATGDAGRFVVRWSGIAMLISLASGFALWWPRKRVRFHRRQSRLFWFDLHNAIGILFIVPLMMLAGTGTIIGFEDQLAPLIHKIDGSTEAHTPASTLQLQPQPGVDVTITPDDAVRIACAQMPGGIAYRVQMPQYGGTYRVSLLGSRDRVAGERNLIVIDPHNGHVLMFRRSNDLSSGDRVFATNHAVHTGEILGLTGRIIAWLGSIMLPVQAVSGFMIWLRRKKISHSVE